MKNHLKSRTMDVLSVEACLCATLLMVWCVVVQSEPSCDQTQFLNHNGSCISCPVCGPGEQLSEDCGFGDGGEGVCTLCEQGRFSTDTDVAPCTRCTQCYLLNRLEKRPCSATRDAMCGRCRPGYYELRSMTGEVEPSCVSCHNRGTIRKECAASKHQSSNTEIAVTVHRGNVQELQEKRVKEGEGTFSTVLIGSAAASSMFLLALLLWAFLLTAEKFKQVAEYCHRSEAMASGADLQCSLLSSPTDRAVKPPEVPTQAFAPPEDPSRCLNSLSHENEVHPTSIVINVTTNIKPGRQSSTNMPQEEQGSSCYSTQEMEQNLQKIWEVAQGQGIEILDYDSVQDLSLLLDAADNRGILRRLGRSLGVPPQVVANLQCFQDLFQYLRTSTYILLPQLAQAAALLPNPEIVARIHQAVVNK